MNRTNTLMILSDEHNRDFLGCYGDAFVRTPNFDRLAASGTIFTNAYCNSPICVPARAALATGQYAHQIGCWDNAHPYHGHVPSWAHRLRDNGATVASIGKLHFRSADDDNGWSEELLPLHVLDGVGDLLGSLRDPPPKRGRANVMAEQAGPGESTYISYDRDITQAACTWLRRMADQPASEPWVLFVSLVCPHLPLIAPPEFYDLYPLADVPWPRLYAQEDRPNHPVIQALAESLNYDTFFDEFKVRRAIAGYYGLCSFLDHNVGCITKALEESGLAENTRVIYSSDHGENLGNRGLWGKSVMYEEAVAVPMIVTGPDIPAGTKVAEPVSLIDIYPTILDFSGDGAPHDDDELPGTSLSRVIAGEVTHRTVFSEYHAAGAITGMYMIRYDKWKYVHYVGYQPQLFDLDNDPHECFDLSDSGDHRQVLQECEEKLRKIVDPEAVNAAAFASQDELIKRHGGPEKIKARGEFGYTPAPGERPILEPSTA